MNTIFKVKYDYFAIEKRFGTITERGFEAGTVCVKAEDIKEAMLIAREKIPELYVPEPTREIIEELRRQLVITDITRVGELLN